MSIATSFLSPKSNRQGKVLPANPMYLDEIPGAMDKMGWRVSAALMRRWFATKPAWVMPSGARTIDDFTAVPATRIDNTLVTMSWLLGFPSVQPALEQLRRGWNSPQALELLQRRLYGVGWTPGRRAMLGYGVRSATMAETACQINYRTFGAYSDTFNDLFGAINKGFSSLL
jgi:hypothetical protein